MCLNFSMVLTNVFLCTKPFSKHLRCLDFGDECVYKRSTNSFPTDPRRYSGAADTAVHADNRKCGGNSQGKIMHHNEVFCIS